METTLNVEGMTCGGCESTVTRALGKLDGVMAAHADHASNTVSVTFDPATIDLEAIGSRIEELGFVVANA